MSDVPPLSELAPLLASLNAMKPPGANRGVIATITNIAVQHVKSEESIVEAFYHAVKKAPATHKLGAIYAIDSVVRQWAEKTKKGGYAVPVESRQTAGTYPAALKRIGDLMPALIQDAAKSMPKEYVPKLENVVNLWSRGRWLPASILLACSSKIRQATDSGAFTPAIKTRPISTPIGYPRQLGDNSAPTERAPPVTQPAQSSTAGITELLSALAKANTGATAAPVDNMNQQLPGGPNGGNGQFPFAMPNGNPQGALLQQGPPASAFGQFPPGSMPGQFLPTPISGQLPPASMSGAILPSAFPHMGIAPPSSMAPQNAFGGQLGPQGPMSPFNQPPFNPPQAHHPQFNPAAFGQPQAMNNPPMQQPASDQQTMLEGVALFKSSLPPEIFNDPVIQPQIGTVMLELMNARVPVAQWGPVIDAFHSRGRAAQSQETFNGRDRSRSPGRGDRRGRGSPVYNNYNHANDMDARIRDSARGQHRQHSPPRQSGNASGGENTIAWNGKPMQPKEVGYDDSLPRDHIRVLSRTLFVGGANGSEAELHQVFSQFGEVQSCLPNREKRHAFVKMTRHRTAVEAKHGMEQLQQANDKATMSVARQTKWGVGFGPRECFNYATGESVIPISKLTDADVKWLHTAEYGGIGNMPITHGQVIEEPDIEIGAGVSSKAMSRRVTLDHNSGGRRNDGGRGGGRRQGGRRGRDDDGPGDSYGGYARPEPVAVATPPAVPGFGFQLPGQ